MESTERFKRAASAAKSIVFLGGAGVSTASGIPDFRSAGGVFSGEDGGVPPETILRAGFFAAHPGRFYEFYKNKMIYKDARPNAAHRALAALEKQGRLTGVVTQNIDGLHQLAGSGRVLELHGSVHRNYCADCGGKYGLDFVLAAPGVPKCALCGGIVRPDVVLYGEGLSRRVLEESAELIKRADMLIAGGTSLRVWPAAGLVEEFGGAVFVIVNREATPYDKRADILIRGDIGESLEAIL